MKITKIFNTSKEEIKKKNFNILIPICVGNRFFLNGITPTENISNYINWALENTKEKMLILVVDKIQISNWIVRNSNVSEKMNMRRLMKRGQMIKEELKKLIEKLPKKEQERIDIFRWEDYYKKDYFCKITTKIVHNEFKKNIKFKKKVLDAVKKSITDRTFNEKEYLTLCNYVLDEFSLVYHGVNLDDLYYGLYIYPETDDVLELIEKIKKEKIFRELANKLDKQKISVVLIK